MSKYQVGDRVFSYSMQKWGKIIKISRNEAYGLRVKFDCGEMFEIYTNDGKLTVGHEAIDLFFDEVPLIPKPTRALQDKDIVVCQDDKHNFVINYCFYDAKNDATFNSFGERDGLRWQRMTYVPDNEAPRDLIATRDKLED